MDDLERYIEERKARAPKFADGFEIGYEQFKIGVILRAAREEAGLTQSRNGDLPPPPPLEGTHIGTYWVFIQLVASWY